MGKSMEAADDLGAVSMPVSRAIARFERISVAIRTMIRMTASHICGQRVYPAKLKIQVLKAGLDPDVCR